MGRKFSLARSSASLDDWQTNELKAKAVSQLHWHADIVLEKEECKAAF